MFDKKTLKYLESLARKHNPKYRSRCSSEVIELFEELLDEIDEIDDLDGGALVPS